MPRTILEPKESKYGQLFIIWSPAAILVTFGSTSLFCRAFTNEMIRTDLSTDSSGTSLVTPVTLTLYFLSFNYRCNRARIFPLLSQSVSPPKKSLARVAFKNLSKSIQTILIKPCYLCICWSVDPFRDVQNKVFTIILKEAYGFFLRDSIVQASTHSIPY